VKVKIFIRRRKNILMENCGFFRESEKLKKGDAFYFLKKRPKEAALGLKIALKGEKDAVNVFLFVK